MFHDNEPIGGQEKQSKLNSLVLSMSIAFFALCLIYIKAKGFFWSGDTYNHVQWADEMLKSNMNPAVFLERTKEWLSGATIFYIIYIYLVAALRALFGENWHFGLAFVNCFCLCFNFFLVFRLLTFLRLGQTTILVGLLMLMICCDYLTWARYLMSDAFFSTVSLSAIYLGSKCFEKPSVRGFRLNIVLFLLLLGVVLFTRPHGLVFLPWTAVLLVFYFSKKDFFRFRAAIFLCLGLLSLAAVLYSKILFSHDDLRRAGWPVEWIGIMKSLFDNGVVVDGREHTYTSPPKDSLNYLEIIFLRFVYFFHFVPDGWSFVHKLLATVYYIPVYIFSLFAIVRPPRTVKKVPALGSVCFGLVLYVLLIDALTSITSLDFDWRYRLSTLTVMTVTFALGFESAREFFKERHMRLKNAPNSDSQPL